MSELILLASFSLTRDLSLVTLQTLPIKFHDLDAGSPQNAHFLQRSYIDKINSRDPIAFCEPSCAYRRYRHQDIFSDLLSSFGTL